MILLISLSIMLGFLLYRSRRSRSLKTFTLFFGILLLALYFFFEGLDVASTPAYYKVYNSTGQKIRVYYLVEYSNETEIVINEGIIHPGNEINSRFEIESAKYVWLVATIDREPAYIHKIEKPFYKEQNFDISDTRVTINPGDRKFATAKINCYRIWTAIKYGLLLLNILLLTAISFTKSKCKILAQPSFQ